MVKYSTLAKIIEIIIAILTVVEQHLNNKNSDVED